MIIIHPPSFHHVFHLIDVQAQFSIQQLVLHQAVEQFDIPILWIVTRLWYTEEHYCGSVDPHIQGLSVTNPWSSNPHWDGKGHFFAAAAEAMRRILVENARRKQRNCHGGDLKKVPMQEADMVVRADPNDLLALDEALTRLEEMDNTKAELVKLRYFTGLTTEQAANILGVSESTAKRIWRFSRAWLHREIG